MVEALIKRAAEAGVFLFVEDRGLRFKLSVDEFPESIKQEILAHKPAIIDYLTLASEKSDTSELYRISPVPRDGQRLPASFSQQRLWFIDAMDGGSQGYHLSGAFSVTGDFDEAIAEASLQNLINRHEVLRSVYEHDGETIWQQVQDYPSFNLERVLLDDLSDREFTLTVNTEITSFANRPFDLANDLMLRACFFRQSESHGVLQFTLHHIAADGWSLNLLMSEFSQLYEAIADRKTSWDACSQDNKDSSQHSVANYILPELNIQYADYAHWQKKFLQSDLFSNQLAYWKIQLADLPQVHSLPLDFPRLPVQSKQGAQYISRCAFGLSELKAFAAEQGITPFMLLQGVFALLIARHSQDGDVVMGTPIANRVDEASEHLVGFFANTLVLRTLCDDNLQAENFLQHIKAVHVAAQANQDVPFDYLVDVLNPPRSTSHDPVFQILFSMNTVAETGQSNERWNLKSLATDVTSANFEITLDVQTHGEELDFHFIYSTDLFTPASIHRLAAHYQTLLQGVMENSTQTIMQLPLMTGIELDELSEIAEDQVSLEDLSGTSEFSNTCIHQLFERQAEMSSEGVAIHCGDESLTYRELNQRANRLAHYLLEQGVQRETPVGVSMPRSMDLVVALLAVLKAGGAYVPMDPAYPTQRLKNIITSSGLQIILSTSNVPLDTSDSSLQIIQVDNIWEPLQCYAVTNPNLPVTASNLAYIIYTSGSTGLPKGVEIEHRNTCAMLRWAQTVFSVEELSLTLASTSINFDLSVFEIFLPLVSGATVLLVENILALIDQPYFPTLINTVPSGIAALIDADCIPSSAITINLAGEPLPEATVNALLTGSQCERVLNLYGPSEDTTYSTIAEYREPTSKVTIGRPIYFSQAYILDAYLEPVPKGVVGELYLAGEGVARGYRNRTDLTDERFITTPFTGDSRLYKTGDLVRWLDTNELEYLGRADDQVKIRGFRIELEEIKQQLLQFYAVKSAAVIVCTDTSSGPYIAAYVTLTETIPYPEDKLQKHIKQVLPDYMVPSVFVILETMPLTANGKINKKALPVPERAVASAEFVAPSSILEKQVAGIWAELFQLPVDSISRNGNFFSLGGHSLLTIRLITLIAKRMSADISIRDVFENSTLSQLADCIARSENNSIHKLPLVAQPRSFTCNEDQRQAEVCFPLSYAQQRLWFVDRLSGGSAHYNIPSALRLSGAFDVVSAEQALQRIVARHEPLRTVFRESGEGAEQVIREQVEFTLRRTDLRERPAAEQTAAVQAAVDADALTAFDLERDVLLRAHFLDLGVDDGVLLFTMHHIVSDGWSMGVLVDEFITQYQAVQAGEPDPLPPLTIQYADFAHWQRQYLQGELRDQQLDFWRTTLADLPPVHSLPLDRPRPAEPGHTGGHANVTVAPATTAALKQLAQAHNATVFMVLHAAATLWLSRHSHSRDIVLGTPVANRLDAQLQPLVGFFVNSLVLRTQVPDSDSRFSDYLAQVRNVNLDAQAHQDIPFELLVDDLKPERTPQYAPLFQIMFSMNTNTASGRSLPGLTLSPLASDAITAKFDLIIAVEEHDDEALTVTLEYNCDLWHAATVEAMAARYGTLLQGLAANPNSRLSDLPLLTDSEHQWLQQHNATHSDYPRDTDLTALVAARAAQHPQRIAARYGDASLTYAALDQRANGVAHHLVDHGVRPGDHVGLYVERSLDMLVGMLGILKAGGAYVPLDTTYPADRLAYMVQDAGVHCVLTQSHLPPLASVNPVALDQWQRSTDHPPAVTIAPTDRAYVIYTSGSTGQPKGVAVTHRNVVRLVHPGSAARNDYPVVETDIVAQASNHAFDAATFEVWGALTQGAQLVGISKDDLLDPVTLRQQLRDQHVSVLFVTTALFNQIAQAAPDSFAHVRVLRFGGEAVDNQWVRTILHHGRPAHLLHVYGPTENTTFSTAYEVTEAETASYPIGFPLAQSSVHVLDPWQQPVPQGSEGELYVGGDGVADGYWQRPELNAERFVRDPFNSDPGARLYRTGDLVRMRADGALVFVGRVDHQIKLRGFRIELGEIEQALLAQPGIRSAIVILREDSPGQKALCAYVVSDEHPSLDAATADALRTRLRDALQQDLPDYMVPAAIEPLAALPLTANGKIDRNALPVPTLSESAGADYQPPANAIEQQLVNLWAELLGRDPATLSVNANFFELGGDSILSIQLVSRALQQGLQLSVKQLFAHQTIRRLAPCVTQGQGIAIPQGPVTGAMPLLPIQRRFLQEAGDRQHFNQAVLLRVPADLDSAALQAVVHHWYQRHDALRLRFVQDANHHWSAEHQPLDDAMLAASWEQVDYRDADSVSRNAQTQQRAMNIHTGPLFKAIHYRPDDGAPDGYRLLLVAHHLIVDGVSWRILLDDAQQWLGQASRGQPLRPAAKTSAYQQWGEWLQDYVHSDAFQSQKAYWHQQISRLASADAQRLHAEQPRCQHGDAGHITLDWSAEHTRALLSQAGRAYRTQVNELLLSGLLLGLSRWSGCTQVLIDLEGHGRESRDERIDLTQTVGWFTSVYPLALSLPDGDNDDLGRLIQQVKQQYRAVPDHGIGYGLLRYLADDPVLADGPQAPVVFNYLGQFDQVVNDDGPFAGAPESRGDDVSPERAMSHALNFNGLVADGCLSFDLSYDPQQYSAETMAALADAVQHSVTALIQHCLDPESGAVSAADFPLVAMDDAVVRDWPHQLNCRPRDVEDLYPATPMQSGLLFHSLLVRSAYVTQLRLTFEGDLDTQAFRQAWHTLQQRHAIFRTAFVGEDHGQLHQAVLANAPVPWHSDNLRHLSAEAQNAHIEAYRDAEYEAGFNLHAAPLMAVALFQTLSAAGEPQTQLLWSHHHALSDGWCLGLIFSELQSAYRAALHGQAPALPPVTPYREYIAWWQRQDMAAARTYWQQVLADIDGPTPLPGGRVSVDDLAAPAVQHHLQLSAAASDRLSALARSTQTTVNTLLQAAWSYLLARYSGDDTVVFGTTVSGRPADLPGVESMVGLFINTLPVVVTVPNDSPIETWLQTLHQQQHARNTYSYIPLADLQRERGISPLFDSLLVFENYPVDRLREQRDEVDPAALRVVGSASVEATNYPLSITASLSDCLHVKLTYQPAQLSQAQVERLGQQLLRVLQQLDSATHVGELSLLSAAETQQALTALQGPRVAYPDTCLHTQFEAQVTRTPDAIAVVADDGELSYAQLNAQANQVARALRARGVSTQTLVGLCATRSCAMLVGLIGILKAGAAYVPIDPNYPPARQTHLLEDSGVNWVVTAGVSELASTEHQCQTLALDSDHIQAELLTLDNDNLNLSDINPRALAYVIYTSGSTGKPKGVMVEHRSIVNLACWMNALANEQFGHHAQNWALNAPVAFDSSLKVITQLGFGRTLYLINADIRLDPDALITYLTDNAIDVVDMTPSLTEIVLTCAETRARRLPHILIGGEAITQRLWQQLVKIGSQIDRNFINVYGPTEATVDTTYAVINESQTSTIGLPIDNMVVHLLDSSRRSVPVGCAGEMYIEGTGLARGYLNRAMNTEESFVTVSIAGHDRRLYKTGDKARLTEKGTLEFIGRTDNQLKIRGFRVELDEINQHVSDHPSVVTSFSCAQHGKNTGTQIVTYVTLASGPEDDATQVAQIRQALLSLLPDFMVPAFIVPLDKLPLNENGKIDRSRLPIPAETMGDGDVVRPTNKLESQLLSIWSELLELDENSISVTQNIFSLGAHSLLMLKVLAKMKQQGIDASLKQLYEKPSIRDFARTLKQPGTQNHGRCIIRLNQCTQGSPLFIFHPYGGRCDGYLGLAKALEKVCPVYGVQAPFNDSQVVRFEQFSELAEFYIHEMRAYQPSGPYNIAGWSAGGNIAAMVANRLVRHKDEVQRLFIIDALLQRTNKAEQTDEQHLMDVLQIELQDEESPETSFVLPSDIQSAINGKPMTEQITLVADYLANLTGADNPMSAEQISVGLQFGIDFNKVDRSVPEFSIGGKSMLITASKNPSQLKRDIFEDWLNTVHASENQHCEISAEHHLMMRGEAAAEIGGLIKKEMQRNRKWVSA